MDYKIKLDKGNYITQTHRKLFPYALKWCLEHGETSCRVNKTYFYFYFDKLLVTIQSTGHRINEYKLKEVQ